MIEDGEDFAEMTTGTRDVKMLLTGPAAYRGKSASGFEKGVVILFLERKLSRIMQSLL